MIITRHKLIFPTLGNRALQSPFPLLGRILKIVFRFKVHFVPYEKFWEK